MKMLTLVREPATERTALMPRLPQRAGLQTLAILDTQLAEAAKLRAPVQAKRAQSREAKAQRPTALWD